MPSSPNYVRNYKQENGNDSPKRKKNRALNNKARRKMTKAGLAKVGDGKDVSHRDNNTRNNSRSNLTMKPKRANRSYARTQTAGRKK
jgi:hypothetical protein